ncbi:DUF6167 family protein [Actinomadura parmotrematis]|uniref:Secreted protein n=1 Tax=Actinomadura parmotrematis TaxID=2864039 RepID=A0ABS7G2J3_9ACTN|nr:DUF6167 family protein [Actinomadura parmotrematis]MBW8486550.1 hypothetical protein [Actinomadura parmotrematis]
MKRLFWLGVGAGAGVYATHRVKRKVTRIAQQLSPEGVAMRAVATGQSTGQRLRYFATDVRTAMHEREEELREAIRMDQAPPEPGEPRPRVLRARYTVIDDDKDGDRS